MRSQGLDFFLVSHTKLLLLIDDEQAKVFILDFLTEQSMCPNNDVNLTVLHLSNSFFFFLSRFKTIDVVNSNREVFKPVTKSFIMLESKNSGRHQNSYLFSITNGFKCGPDADF